MFGPNASLSQRDKSVAAKTETPIESQTEKSSLGATKKPSKAETRERETDQNTATSAEIKRDPVSERKREAIVRMLSAQPGLKLSAAKISLDITL